MKKEKFSLYIYIYIYVQIKTKLTFVNDYQPSNSIEIYIKIWNSLVIYLVSHKVQIWGTLWESNSLTASLAWLHEDHVM